MAKEVFNRYEHKYIINGKIYNEVLKILDSHMEIDPYNKGHKPYTIANIYYDTADDYLIRNSLSKPIYKEKLRLRSYGVPKNDTEVYLEIKKKFNGIVNKRRTKLILNEAYDFIEKGKATEIKSYMNGQVVSELEYFLNMYDLHPKLYLAYDRVAYFEKDNADLRISFDRDIRSRRTNLRLEAGDYGEKMFKDDVYLMEIKTSLAKPLWLAEILSEFDIKRCSFSKYGTEYKNMINSSSGIDNNIDKALSDKVEYKSAV